MAVTGWLAFWLLATLCNQSWALDNSSYEEISQRYTRRTERGIHLPIVPVQGPTSLEKRGKTTSIGLGDFIDISYNVLVRVGGILTPVILDTGSSDLWVVSDACTSCAPGVPLYPQSTFKSTGLEANLKYGDSKTGTFASGLIGSDTVDIAGLTVPEQHFAAINTTNTIVIKAGSAGIFGLGFASNSLLWNKLFTETVLHSDSNGQPGFTPPKRRRRGMNYVRPQFPNLNFRQPSFPNLSFEENIGQGLARRASDVSTMIFDSYKTISPFLGRLLASNEIDPLFAVTLQRDTFEIGGNIGQLSIGELPPGVQSDSLTWAPVRLYPKTGGGLPAPPDSPNEMYPIAWEIPIDDIYLDGQVLPRSRLSSPQISLSALVDTGNSLIRGPRDVVGEIMNRIGASLPCSEAHILEFSIGGKLFPVDPRDLISSGSGALCTPNIVSTDSPTVGTGYQFSWSLGTPFLKGVLSAYHFGNIQYPSRDLPKIGFLSTVPDDAVDKLKAAVRKANGNGANLPTMSERPPTPSRAPGTVAPTGVPVTTEAVRGAQPTQSSGANQGAPGTQSTSQPSGATGDVRGAQSTQRSGASRTSSVAWLPGATFAAFASLLLGMYM